MENSFYHLWSFLTNLFGLWFAGYWLFCLPHYLYGKGIPSLWYQIALFRCSSMILCTDMFTSCDSSEFLKAKSSLMELVIEMQIILTWTYTRIILTLFFPFWSIFRCKNSSWMLWSFDSPSAEERENITEVEEIDEVWVHSWVTERLKRSHDDVEFTRKPSRFEIPWWLRMHHVHFCFFNN